MRIDIHNPNSKKFKIWLPVTIGLMICIWLSYQIIFPSTPEIDAVDISFVEVQQNDLDIYVTVFGTYESEHEQILSAPGIGLVTKLLVRVGQPVTPNTVIAEISNQDLNQEYINAKSELESVRSELLSLQFSKQNEQLDFQSRLADISASVASAELEVKINSSLVKDGIVGRIDLDKAKLALELNKKKEEFAKFRFEKLKEMHKLQIQQQQNLVNQRILAMEGLANKLDSLNIKAGITGTLQNLSVEIGQRVSLGSDVAKVGSSDQLMVSINIPEKIAHRVKDNAIVKIKHQSNWLKAIVLQKGSVVQEGFIVAEVQLIDATPKDVRPSQSVVGEVFLETLSNALYVKQKPSLVPLSKSELFKWTKQQTTLNKTPVSFGELTGKHLVINSGAQVGDRFVVSDMSRWQRYKLLKLNQQTL